ncbi:hypothetical protein SNEBB_006543, partial [Seison nebaliae]
MSPLNVYSIPPIHYIHVLDRSTNVTRLEKGPQTFVRKDNEKVTLSITKMIMIPAQHYCVIKNPLKRNKETNELVTNEFGQIELEHSDIEMRFEQAPFPLYPGEIMEMAVQALTIVKHDCALRLQAVLDFKEGEIERAAGNEWLFKGPGTYIPRKEVEVIKEIKAEIIQPNTALKLRARKEFTDRLGEFRNIGQEWLIYDIGAYLPDVCETVLEMISGVNITDNLALQLTSTQTFVDRYGIKRANGDIWLITAKETDVHIPDVYERVIKEVPITTLTNCQYVIIENPINDQGKNQWGKKKLLKGICSFFLYPNEILVNGICDVPVLVEDEGLLLQCNELFTDENGVERKPGDRWMIRGPGEYIPNINCEIIDRRKAIPLDKKEGIYVRNIKNGNVRAVIGETYLLNEDEELFDKQTDQLMNELLKRSNNDSKVISYSIPHNAAVQIYDYKNKIARIVFGPELVLLMPDEQLTILSLSGKKPKIPNIVKSLHLLLGPEFSTDIIIVETLDHARLSLQISYNWHFHIQNRNDPVECATIFSQPDPIGDMCKTLASRIRGKVASVYFDDFHKHSARIIRTSVFGLSDEGKVKESFVLEQNSLVVTNIDIQYVEPVDQRTRDSLQKSVQLAIEITTNSQEASAHHEAERIKQNAKGKLDRQKIHDEAEAEKVRRSLLSLEAQSNATRSTGQAKAEAQSNAESARIIGESKVDNAELKVKADAIMADAELEQLKKARTAELNYDEKKDELDIQLDEELSQIEIDTFNRIVGAIGEEAIISLATAESSEQKKILKALNIDSSLIGNSGNAVNLFDSQ